jgi:class I fructose-bisphosphate aldolase
MEVSMSSVGKEVRLRRLLHNTNTSVSVAFDHAISWGVIPGIENIRSVISDLAEVGPDSFTILKGTALRCYEEYLGRIPFILKATSFSPFHPAYDTPLATVEEAMRLGADAISIGTTVGGENQPELLRNLGEAVRIADHYGLPTVTHIYPKGEGIPLEDRYKMEHVVYAARIAAELGVDIIKTSYTGSPETFRKVIEAAAPSRVVISGGPKSSSLREFFSMTRDGMDVGAVGVTYGRNIWQGEKPKAILKALLAMVHDKASVDAALQIVEVSE